MGAAKAAGDIAQPLDCRGLLEAIEQQKALLLRETGQIKREIAALRQEMTNPGVKDALAGIGYIFGITGLALYFHCRKSKGA
jgi:nickel transport protein